ncbi:MAG: DUF3054 domain-containing protein [Thermoleophilia bacterium]
MSTVRPAPPPHPASRSTGRAGLLALDLVAIAAFVLIGRRSHGLTTAGIATTIAPFWIGAAVGWLAARADRAPLSLRTGAVVWAVTLVVGMALRNMAFGDGTAASFIMVAGVFLLVTFLGWRLVAIVVSHR